MFNNNWMRPATGTLLDRLFRSDRGQVPPGGFLCGLRTERGAVRGLTSDWRYAMSSIDGHTLLFGSQNRYPVLIADPRPIESELDPRPDFRVWAAVLLADAAEVGGQAPPVSVQLAVHRRDVYKVVESGIVRPSAGGA